MCGIAGIHRRGNAQVSKIDRLATELLLAIEYRGRDAAGYVAVMDSGKVQLEKRVGPASRFVRRRGKINPAARSVLLHSRYKTTGTKATKDAHPHASGTIASVHNGTIYNAEEIFTAFDLPRNATVDSEVVPALINYAGWGQAEHALSLLDGSAALGIVNTETPKELILACVRSFPLCYAVTDEVVIFASTERAIREAWRNTYRSELRAQVVHMLQGDIIRVNGDLEMGRIPGIELPTRKPYAPGKTTMPKSKKGRARQARKEQRALKAAPGSRTRTTYSYTEIDRMLDIDTSGDVECMECNEWVLPDEAIGGVCEDCLTGLPLWDRDYLQNARGKSPATLAWEALDAS